MCDAIGPLWTCRRRLYAPPRIVATSHLRHAQAVAQAVTTLPPYSHWETTFAVLSLISGYLNPERKPRRKTGDQPQ